MRELPCLMNGEGVRATLAGVKTQTRRPMRPQPVDSKCIDWILLDKGNYMAYAPMRRTSEMSDTIWHNGIRCPLGVPGDLLYVRETFCVMQDIEACALAGESIDVVYRADEGWADLDKWELEGVGVKWSPSIHMPKWAARLWLVNTGVRVGRVQGITIDDAMEEGIGEVESAWVGLRNPPHPSDWITAYGCVWDSIYVKRGLGWDANPWVWVTSYEVTER